MIFRPPTAIFVTSTLLYFAIRVYWQNKAKLRPVAVEKSFILDRLNIGLVGVFTMVVPMVALFSHALDSFNYPEHLVLTLLSIPFLFGGLIVFWKSHHDLGEFWSVTLELKEGHALVTTGIYRSIRHPMYTSIWLYAIGQALCVPNYVGGLGGAIACAILYFVRIEKEEQMLIDKFGDEYRAYMARTKRLIPHVL